MVSLKEDKAKKLTQVLSNSTSRKILDYLSNKDASESEIAKELGIPISTAHYNLKLLKETKLVEVEEFHYSKKGKEVDHYKLANKYIIIAPKEDSGFMDKLKSILPSVLIFAGGLWGWQNFSGSLAGTTAQFAESAPVAAEALARDSIALVEPVATSIVQAQPIWPYFVYGALAFFLIYLIVDKIRKKFL